MILPEPRLLLITDRRASPRPLTDTIAAVLAGGCRWVMLREKDLATDALIDLGAPIAELTRRARACLLVNGDIAAAVALRANGVHLPQGPDMAGAIMQARAALGGDALIGVSAHDAAEVRGAADAGADYATISPIFLTESKPGYGPALGTETLARIAAETPLPLIALGGLTPERTAPCLAAGAAGVAVMGAIARARDPADLVTRYCTALAETDGVRQA